MKPSIGRIVIYRNRAGVDMPAVITALGPEDGFVHLHPFPPPGAANDRVMDREWGIEDYDADAHGPAGMVGRWRWPERIPLDGDQASPTRTGTEGERSESPSTKASPS